MNDLGIIDRFMETFSQYVDSGFGLQATPGGMTADDLLKPGKIAVTGYEAAYPLLEQVSQLVGFPEIFGNALTVFVLLVAWFLVLIAFFILAIQLFITVLEFKLTTLAGFVLVPFALWNKTSFLAERVLGNVISSGIKVMVLAVIAGISSTLFSTFTTGLQGKGHAPPGSRAAVRRPPRCKRGPPHPPIPQPVPRQIGRNASGPSRPAAPAAMR